MPYTTTHVLVGIILIELFRDFFIKDNKKFPRYYILIMAFASVFPDLEYIFQIPNLHRSLLHTLLLSLIFLGAGGISYFFGLKNKQTRKRHLKIPIIFFILAAGSFLHIVLDVVLRDGALIFYPFSSELIGLSLASYMPVSESVALIVLDTLLLFFWIFWLEFKLKVRDYF